MTLNSYKISLTLISLLIPVLLICEPTAQEVEKEVTTVPITAPQPTVHHRHTHHYYKSLDCRSRNGSCHHCIHNSDCYYCSSDKSCHYYRIHDHRWRQKCRHLRDMYWDTCGVSVQTMTIICFSIFGAILVAALICCIAMCRSWDRCRRGVRQRQEQQWTEMQDRQLSEMAAQQTERRQKHNSFLTEFRANYSRRPPTAQLSDQPNNTGKSYVRFD